MASFDKEIWIMSYFWVSLYELQQVGDLQIPAVGLGAMEGLSLRRNNMEREEENLFKVLLFQNWVGFVEIIVFRLFNY